MKEFGTNLFGEPVLHRAAHFAAPGIRSRLSRDWCPGPRALVIGCNPSSAGANADDQTSRWWNAWFHLFGFGGYDAMNLYPFCTSSPPECRSRVERAMDGADWHDRDHLFANLEQLVKTAKQSHQVFVCWGAIAWDSDWIDHVVEEIQTGVEPYPNLWCWGKTASGAPKHPLARGKHRIDPHQQPILWKAA